jgi:hypothetical protein
MVFLLAPSPAPLTNVETNRTDDDGNHNSYNNERMKCSTATTATTAATRSTID